MTGNVLWLVAHFDLHGTGAILRDGLDEAGAKALADAYERKGHHQAYVAYPYTASDKADLLRRERILA